MRTYGAKAVQHPQGLRVHARGEYEDAAVGALLREGRC